jgi:Protein of unknown function (DUF3631)
MTITLERETAPVRGPTEPGTAINGALALDEARAFVARFWVPPSQGALDAMILWAAHTHATDKDNEMVWRSTPRIAFVSDEPGSGKTFCLELLELLCARGMLVEDPTGPALLKAIQTVHPTLLVDEVDLLFGNGAAGKSVRGIINSGYRRGAGVLRTTGSQSTFAPAALAGLASSFMGNPTLNATRTRCIIVRCSAPPEGVKRARYRDQLHAPLGALTGAAIAEWASGAAVELAMTWPDMPEELSNRALDVWEPLFAVAEVAGGHWPETVRAACRELTMGERHEGTEPVLPPRMRLLADIHSVWPQGADRMATADLVRALSRVDGAPWASMWTPVQMTREIPAMLAVEPRKIKANGKAVQGYYRRDLAPLWMAAKSGTARA